MTPAPPLAREAFDLDPAIVYLNHAAVGVLPRATAQALHAFVDGHATRGVLGVFPTERQAPRLRAAVGGLIGASGDQIALVRNTSDAATVLAQGLDVRPGDEIVINRNEFGANAYPWLALRARGAIVRFIDAPRERMTPDTLRAVVGPRTRAVALSWVTFDDGYRHDIAGLAEVAHGAGALLFVDAIQALGAFPFDVNALGADAVYAGGAKWLLALQGVGFLYLRANLLDRIAVNLPGWRSVADMWDFLDYDQPWAPDATRYEGGTPNFIGALALGTSIGVLQAAGIERIAAHVVALTDRLVEGLQRCGATVASPRASGISSGIVRFELPGCDSAAIGKHLAEAGFVTTNRANGVRVSPHGYNTFEEIDALVAAVEGLRALA